MIKVNIVCVGKIKESFYRDAVAEYAKRLSRFCRFEVKELAEGKNPEDEADSILKNAKGHIIALCIEGKELSSEALAELVAKVEGSGRPRMCFIIGGSYGLSPKVKARADLKLSMSPMTFPHHLARVMLSEQLYRSFKINEGSRYHK